MRISSIRPAKARLILGLLLATLASNTASAALRKISFESMVAKSKFIVVGQVVSMGSRWDNLADTGEVMMTDVRIKVEEVWKDSLDRRKDIVRPAKSSDGPTIRELTVQFLGGQIGDRWQRCPESPKYQVGERVVLFVRIIDGRLWTTGWLQGKYRFHRDKITGRNGEPDRVYETVMGKAQLPISINTPLATLRDRVQKTIAIQRTRPPLEPGKIEGGSSSTTHSHDAKTSETSEKGGDR